MSREGTRTTTCTGWMWKQGEGPGSVANFARRWFCLEVTERGLLARGGNKPKDEAFSTGYSPAQRRIVTLYYYKNIEDAKPRGSIPLIEDKYHIGPPKEQRRGYDHAFRLDVDQPTSPASPRSDERGRNRKKYIIAPETAAEKLRWERALRLAFRRPEENDPRSPEIFAEQPTFQRLVMNDRDRCLMMAEICWQAQRYDEMADQVTQLASLGTELSEAEEVLFCRAFHHSVGRRREAWRALALVQQRQENSVDVEAWRTGAVVRRVARVAELRKKVEGELASSCDRVLGLLEATLIPRASRPSSRVNYLKMCGDYNRYFAEFCCGPVRKERTDKAIDHYRTALMAAKRCLPSTNPTRLALALNYSSFLGEILGECEQPKGVGDLRRASLVTFSSLARPQFVPVSYSHWKLCFALEHKMCTTGFPSAAAGEQHRSRGVQPGACGSDSRRADAGSSGRGSERCQRL